MADEMTKEEIFNQQYVKEFMEQQKRLNPMNPDVNNQQLGSSDNLSIDEKKILDDIQTNSPTKNEISPTNAQCPECGMFHPPTGEKPCPNASLSKTNQKIDDGKVNKYLVQWRDIILTHIQKLNIEDWEKVFQEATIMFAKNFDGTKK